MKPNTFVRSCFLAVGISWFSCMVFLAGPATGQQPFLETSFREQKENDSLSASHPAGRGLDLILNRRFLPADFDTETFENTWRVWPAALSAKAEARPELRRQMAFERYGFTPRKDKPDWPLQYVVDPDGQWAMNCFTCHGGSLYGESQSFPGLPNNRIALETLYEDLAKTKRLLKKKYSGMDLGRNLVSLGTTNGTSNAVIFGVSLMAFRDRHLDLKSFFLPPRIQSHDMDAPPWWHYKKRKMLYVDGFTQKHHRALMPFIMVRQNDGPTFRGYEADFELIEDFIRSVKPPRYPHPVSGKLVMSGKKLFRENCASCHGNYGDSSSYPEKRVDLEEIGTDPVRLHALSSEYRRRYGESWLGEYGKARNVVQPTGYVAPPLDGIWATAPYLHNGSVPTLRGVLHPNDRPLIWKRTDDRFNHQDAGLSFKALDSLPEGLSAAERRRYFDTRVHGKSNRGHDFAEKLTVDQVDALLEYLKTL